MKVLVTGGAGWIGQATCRELESQGHEPVVYDRTHAGDIRDRDAVDAAVAGVDHVIHLAGLLGTHELFEQPHEAAEVNVLGSLNVTVSCSKHDVGLTEITMPRVNPSLYAASKACAMDMALAYQRAGKLQCSFVCAYNAYGPGQAFGDGHPQKILPTFATYAWQGRPIPIWGQGNLLTDLVHVDDVARILVETMPLRGGQCVDAGTGFNQSVLEVAESVLNYVHGEDNWDISECIEHLPERPGERRFSTNNDFASGKGWEYLGGWRPVFDYRRFREAIDSYKT